MRLGVRRPEGKGLGGGVSVGLQVSEFVEMPLLSKRLHSSTKGVSGFVPEATCSPFLLLITSWVLCGAKGLRTLEVQASIAQMSA